MVNDGILAEYVKNSNQVHTASEYWTVNSNPGLLDHMATWLFLLQWHFPPSNIREEKIYKWVLNCSGTERNDNE